MLMSYLRKRRESSESNLIKHARYELQRAGLFDEDADYGGMLGGSVMEMVEVFAKQGHSGFSAGLTVDLLGRLLRYEPLTDLTDDPEEWVDHGFQSLEMSEDGNAVTVPLWQNKRNSKAFSRDGGKTYTLLDDEAGKGTVYESVHSDG